MIRYTRLVPLIAIGAAAVLGLVALERQEVERFDAARTFLAAKRVLKAGPIEIADCGAKGCGDASDTIYRLTDGDALCFRAQRATFLGDETPPTGSALLVADRVGQMGVVLLDMERGLLAPSHEHRIAPIPCPKRAAGALSATQ